MATFHSFPRLPYELRAQIWEYTIEPRTVQLKMKRRDPRYFTSATPVPPLLQVCRETRYYGRYQMSFSIRYVWLCPEIDIIDIGEACFGDFQAIAHLFRRLKFKREESDDFYYHAQVRELGMFVNVKEIYVVCAGGLDAWIGALDQEHHWPCRKEDVFFIDPNDDDRVFRGAKGLEMIR
ncbi:hypothetical protein DM02DRAFT_638313 [Periconia macrospinosa]|uniref:2EXR domain-containing protein n=1 Tax=Periconia macrospinosa TaxID=97972 RepID=A0A2V1E8L0_9PLEO|nr:hypothetical protein DM02DRAFT_638313 [Periconia macrospinosa]